VLNEVFVERDSSIPVEYAQDPSSDLKPNKTYI